MYKNLHLNLRIAFNFLLSLIIFPTRSVNAVLQITRFYRIESLCYNTSHVVLSLLGTYLGQATLFCYYLQYACDYRIFSFYIPSVGKNVLFFGCYAVSGMALELSILFVGLCFGAIQI